MRNLSHSHPELQLFLLVTFKMLHESVFAYHWHFVTVSLATTFISVFSFPSMTCPTFWQILISCICDVVLCFLLIVLGSPQTPLLHWKITINLSRSCKTSSTSEILAENGSCYRFSKVFCELTNTSEFYNHFCLSLPRLLSSLSHLDLMHLCIQVSKNSVWHVVVLRKHLLSRTKILSLLLIIGIVK